MGLSYRFRDKRRFQLSCKFFLPRVFNVPAEGVPLGIVYRRSWSKKTIMMGLSGQERRFAISSIVLIQYTNVTDGLTDTGRQQRPRLRIASRGYNITTLAEVTLGISRTYSEIIDDIWRDIPVLLQGVCRLSRRSRKRNFYRASARVACSARCFVSSVRLSVGLECW